MSSERITALASGTCKSTDLHVAVDTTDTSMAPTGTDKKYTLDQIQTFVNTAVSISGGSMDGVEIGAGMPAPGIFTNLTSNNVTITGGTIDNVDIGLITQGAARFNNVHLTNLTASLTITNSAFTTAGIVHNSSSGFFTTSLIVNTDITANTITNSSLAQSPALSILGNNTGSSANVAYLSVPQVNAMLGVPVVSITAGEVAFGTSPGAIGGNANFIFDSTHKSLLIGTSTVDATAILSLNSTTQIAYIPSMTTTQRTAITPSREAGFCFDNTLKQFCGWDGTSWQVL